MEELKAKLDDLLDKVDGLTKAAEHLTPRVDEMERTGRRARAALWSLGVFVVILGALGALLGKVIVDQRDTTAQLTQLVQDQRGTTAQLTRVVQESLCPVFALLIGAYNPESRPEGAARDAYNQQFSQFSASYQALACRNAIVPPPIRR
jgi:cytoskeletal protein RodZ